jgi:hypothetical protein
VDGGFNVVLQDLRSPKAHPSQTYFVISPKVDTTWARSLLILGITILSDSSLTALSKPRSGDLVTPVMELLGSLDCVLLSLTV